MKTTRRLKVLLIAVFVLWTAAVLIVTDAARAQQQRPSSFSPVIEEPFDVVRARDKAAKAGVAAAHQPLLEARYDLTRRVDESVRMTRGKPIPVGPTAKLTVGLTGDRLGQMSPIAIRDQEPFPYLPLPPVNPPFAAWCFRRLRSNYCRVSNGSTWI